MDIPAKCKYIDVLYKDGSVESIPSSKEKILSKIDEYEDCYEFEMSYNDGSGKRMVVLMKGDIKKIIFKE